MKEDLLKLMKTAENTFGSPNHKANKEENFTKYNAEMAKMINSLREESDTP